MTDQGRIRGTRVATLALLLATLLIVAAPARADVTGVTVTNDVPSAAAGARTQYVIEFTATSGLPQSGTITLAFPDGTDLSTRSRSAVLVAGDNIGSCVSTATRTMQCSLFGGHSIAPGQAVRITLDGIANPAFAAPNYSMAVSTSSDSTLVESDHYAVVDAQQVSDVAADDAAVSTAAGARTQYAIAFTTSSTGGLADVGNSRIELTFPSGTDFSARSGSAVLVDGTNVGSCIPASGQSPTMECTLFGGKSIGPGKVVRITLNGITNAAAGSHVVGVATTSDPQAVDSSPYTVVTNQPVTNVTADNSAVSTAAGARTQYAVTFTTSSTGGLADTANSRIDVSFPSGTDFAARSGSTVLVDGTNVGSCIPASGQSPTMECALFGGKSIAAGKVVHITLNGITNPATAGDYVVDVSTTSDTTLVASSEFAVTAAQQVSNVGADNTAVSNAAGARTQYAITFTTSSTGDLADVGNSEINLSFPSGTDFSARSGSAVTAGGTNIGSCIPSGTLTMRCGLFGGRSIDAGQAVRITLNGITNAPGGNGVVKVSTTSDPRPVDSGSFQIVASHPVANPAVALGSSAQSAVTRYTITFDTSTTGGLADVGNSQINLSFPSGTDFSTRSGSAVTAGGTNIGSCIPSGTLTMRCGLFGGKSIEPGRHVQVTLDGIGNPAGPTTAQLGISTTSDTGASATYSIGADTTPPAATIDSGPSGTTADTTPTFAFSSNEAGSDFECRLDAEPFAACTSPFTPAALASGPHTFDVVAIDPAGNRGAPMRRSFTVATPTPTPSPTPTSTPTPAPSPAPVPTPDFDKTFNALEPEGVVKVKLPGTNRFVTLAEGEQLPKGTLVDATKGRITLESADKKGKTQRAAFYEGAFKVAGQTKGAKPITLLDLAGPKPECSSPKAKKSEATASRKRRRHRSRHLWGNGHGRFRTTGEYSSATVRGTIWLTQDSCKGTLVKVRRGVVDVRDFTKRKTFKVRAGHSHLSRTPRKRP